MKRIEILDGMRGYFLVFMLINHVILTGGLWMQNVTLGQVMFVEDAQGFVFLSGLLIGLIQYRRMERKGVAAMRQSIHHRAFELYLYAMGAVIVVYAARAVLPAGEWVFRNWLGMSGLDDPSRALGILTMIFQPTFMDILPQYILYLLISPPLIRMVAQGRWPEVVAMSVMAWVIPQIGADNLLAHPLNALFLAGDNQGLRGGFNPLAWQILFVSGLVIGALTASGKINWDRIIRPEKTAWPKMAALFLLLLVPARIGSDYGWFSGQDLALLNQMTVRNTFGPLYLMSFAAACTLFTWLVVAGREVANPIVRGASVTLRWIGSLWILRLVGRHSLQTYAWHVVLIYGLRYIDAMNGPFDAFWRTVMTLICLALLPLPALWRDYGHLVLNRASTRAG